MLSRVGRIGGTRRENGVIYLFLDFLVQVTSARFENSALTGRETNFDDRWTAICKRDTIERARLAAGSFSIR